MLAFFVHKGALSMKFAFYFVDNEYISYLKEATLLEEKYRIWLKEKGTISI